MHAGWGRFGLESSGVRFRPSDPQGRSPMCCSLPARKKDLEVIGRPACGQLRAVRHKRAHVVSRSELLTRASRGAFPSTGGNSMKGLARPRLVLAVALVGSLRRPRLASPVDLMRAIAGDMDPSEPAAVRMADPARARRGGRRPARGWAAPFSRRVPQPSGRATSVGLGWWRGPWRHLRPPRAGGPPCSSSAYLARLGCHAAWMPSAGVAVACHPRRTAFVLHARLSDNEDGC